MARGRRVEETTDEFEEKVLYINRCAKVVKGGRKFSFSALILVGNRAGQVGCGFAKANEVSDAIKKGSEAARKNVFTFEMDGTTIPHDVLAEYDGVKLLMKRARPGTGIVAGSVVRSFLSLAGVTDVVCKNFRSNNPYNQAKATEKALKSLKNRQQCLAERGIEV